MHSEDTQDNLNGGKPDDEHCNEADGRRGDASVPLTIREVESEDDEMENEP
jgi:hypothetical protein